MTCTQFVIIGLVYIVIIRAFLVFFIRLRCLSIIAKKQSNPVLVAEYLKARSFERMVFDLTSWTLYNFFPDMKELFKQIK